ncbi:facilitated trehalose transporter Tret1-like [Harmonia axyridis]|uniref:facilitated trehalose transporter Tret1-like n=1 Tax=Harmonia axyridis TaxID=115357 RepID=UPI001E2757D9|nr:facilitated trehalose transporter Tret1-like [Harmonia axyridis]
MAYWEKFANYFGPNYTLFIVVIAHCNIYLSFISYSWISPVLSKLNATEDNPLGNPITKEDADSIAALFYIGAAIGPILVFGIVDKIGRRNILIAVSYIPPIVYGVLMFANTITLYQICRFVLGLSTGVIFSVEPVFVSEMVSKKERPFLMAIITAFSFFGIFSSVSIGPFIPLDMFNGYIAFDCLAIALLMTFGFPESPYFLMKTEGEQAARELLSTLRPESVEEELSEISKIITRESKGSRFGIFGSLKNFKAFILCTFPFLLQSYSGMILILTHCDLIFMETTKAIPSMWSIIIVVSITLLTSFITPVLITKKVPVFTLFVYCLCGVATCDLIMALYFLFGRNIEFLSWLPLVVLVCFAVIYNFGLDPIPWMLLGQSYPLKLRAFGTAISTSIFQLSLLSSLYFYHWIAVGYLFLFSSIFSLIGVIYFKFIFVPDTEKTEEETEMRVVT